MATVKEVKITKNGEMVTPVVLSDSMYNLDGTKYKTHTHDDRYYTESEIDSKVSVINTSLNGKSNTSHTHDDRYYTESEIDARKPKSHSVSGNVSNTVVTLDGMEIGDIRCVEASFTFKSGGSLGIRDAYGTTDKTYLIFKDFGNFPNSPIHEWEVKHFLGNLSIWSIANTQGYDYTDKFSLVVIRLS